MSRDEIMQLTLDVGTIDIKGELISEHYLKDRLKNTEKFRELSQKAEEKFDDIKQIYDDVKSTIEFDDEEGIKQDFLEPILTELGHTKARRHREAPFLSHKGRERVPDYVLFDEKENKDSAKQSKDDSDRYFDHVIGLIEAKKPTRDLDKGRKENPAVQTKTYLRLTDTKWGILTNGKKWRLYCKESGYSSNVYLEFDLFNILQHDKLAHFKYFYAFFSHDAFRKDGGKSFLDEVYEENVKFAREVEDDLEKNVYEALAILAEGFLEYNKNDLDVDDLEEIHDSSLILLYRMLFLFYAESKGLIEFNYDRNSILKIREEIREDLENDEKYAPLHDDYWRRLKETFDIVNYGSEEVLGEEGVPPYNGGLFDSEKHSFLDENRIGNNYLMRAVDRLAARKENGDMQWVDYETLQIRHLGSIYEKLLEYKLDLAEDDLTVDDGEYVEAGESDEVVVEEDEVYLKTDKGERKATGSYYTPDYIVEYIVENTVGELIDEKVEEAKENGESEAKAILELNVLDPAMGSGHFLVGAVEYMAEELVQAVNRDIENDVWDGEEIDQDEAKREIVSHCIYGVDVNPLAVELAKLSLWLTTLSEGKPLNFLDHRLKCGNSLVGSDLLEVAWYPPELLSGKGKKEAEKRRKERREGGQETFEIPFVEAVGDFISKIDEESDENIENVLHKKELFDELQDSNEYRRLKTICDLHTG
ncbi:MAG: DNA methyltransferase, partial [Thermoplasmatota archaeon]